MFFGRSKICGRRTTRLRIFTVIFVLIFIFSSFNWLNEMFLAQRETDSLVEEKQQMVKEFKNLMKIYGDNPDKSLKNSSLPQKHNFVFIKCMKCATETLANVFRLYGHVRNLSFVLPVDRKIYLGWPYLMNESHYRPSSKGFNILVEHSIFNDTITDKLMSPDNVYISIIREPYKHFESVFHYFNIKNIAKVVGSDPVTEYLENIEHYDKYYKSPEAAKLRYCIPDGFSITKNLMSHCLGMPLGFPANRTDISNDQERVISHIKHLDRKFMLIMLVEYFQESLILLKRLMNWSFKDVIYYRVNSAKYSSSRTEKNMQIHRKWSAIDYVLYDHFNKTFWNKVKLQGDDFFEEVKLFNSAQRQVTAFCDIDKPGAITISANAYDDGFTYDHKDCLLLKKPIFLLLKNKYDADHGIKKA